jgi:hypothetical protein
MLVKLIRQRDGIFTKNMTDIPSTTITDEQNFSP